MEWFGGQDQASAERLALSRSASAGLVYPCEEADISGKREKLNSARRYNNTENFNSEGVAIVSNGTIELGAFIECVDFRYLQARYKVKFLVPKLGESADENGLKEKDLQGTTFYLLRHAPETGLSITIDGSNQRIDSIEEFAMFAMLLVKVNDKNLYPKFQLSKLRDELSCSSGNEREIKLQVKLLRERRAVLPAARYRKIQENMKIKKHLWKSDPGSQQWKSEPESKDITLSYTLKKDLQGFPSERNDLRPMIPKPGLKEEYDLREASEKVITLLSRVTMSNVWSTCSPNIYGSHLFVM